MKKTIGAVVLAVLCVMLLTGCGKANNKVYGYSVNAYDCNTYESHVYCTGCYNGYCIGCERWTDDVDISSAYSITCTNVSTGNNYECHQHYCVTFIK